ncbi:MAG TPA: hypothetical protein VGD88_06035 [Opitutaceae bacterium]
MPTPSFTHSNTGPSGITLPATTPTDSSPDEAGSVPSFSNDAPDGVGTPATPDNTAPTGISLPATTPTSDSPDAHGTPATPTTDAPDGIGDLANDQEPTGDAPSPIDWVPIVTDPTNANMHTASLNLIGNLTLDQEFGYYKAPAACVNLGLQISLQKAPTGSDAIIELVNSAGDSLGREVTIPAGAVYAEITHETPLPLTAGSIVRGKVKQKGSTIAGAYATLTLIQQLV